MTPWVLGRASADDAIRIDRAIDAAIDVLPLLMSGNLNEAMKRLHTPAAGGTGAKEAGGATS